MAEVETKSTAITNRDAEPAVLTDAYIAGSRLEEAVGHVQTNSDDSVNSEYLMVAVPSNARISQVLLSHDDSGTTGAADVGLFDLDGAVVDADLFASAVDLNTAAQNNLDVTHESGVYGVEDSEQRLWELAGESEDPRTEYIIGLKLTEAVTAAILDETTTPNAN